MEIFLVILLLIIMTYLYGMSKERQGFDEGKSETLRLLEEQKMLLSDNGLIMIHPEFVLKLVREMHRDKLIEILDEDIKG